MGLDRLIPLNWLEDSYHEAGLIYARMITNEQLQRYFEGCGPLWEHDGRFQERRALHALECIESRYVKRGFEPVPLDRFIAAARGEDLGDVWRRPLEVRYG